jgi:hypothetical protein
MRREDTTSIPHRRLRALALALAAVVATGSGASSATATARPAEHRHEPLEATASASPSGIGCNDYWTRAETLTGIPRDVQIGMTAIGYATVGAPQPEPCTAN